MPISRMCRAMYSSSRPNNGCTAADWPSRLRGLSKTAVLTIALPIMNCRREKPLLCVIRFLPVIDSWQTKTLREFYKPLVAAQIFENRIDLQKRQPVKTFRARLLEFVEREFTIVKPGMDDRGLKRRHVLLLRQLLQTRNRALRVALLSRQRLRMAQRTQRGDVIRRDLQRRAKRIDRLIERALRFEDQPELVIRARKVGIHFAHLLGFVACLIQLSGVVHRPDVIAVNRQGERFEIVRGLRLGDSFV